MNWALARENAFGVESPSHRSPTKNHSKRKVNELFENFRQQVFSSPDPGGSRHGICGARSAGGHYVLVTSVAGERRRFGGLEARIRIARRSPRPRARRRRPGRAYLSTTLPGATKASRASRIGEGPVAQRQGRGRGEERERPALRAQQRQQANGLDPSKGEMSRARGDTPNRARI